MEQKDDLFEAKDLRIPIVLFATVAGVATAILFDVYAHGDRMKFVLLTIILAVVTLYQLTPMFQYKSAILFLMVYYSLHVALLFTPFSLDGGMVGILPELFFIADYAAGLFGISFVVNRFRR